MASLRVEVVYALAREADAVSLRLPSGATAADAVRASGLLEKYSGIAHAKIGIYGKLVSADTRLVDGDRVEIYRPLRLDPKEARRRRAVKKV
ncbi:MAG TPA: RnfH family protein [Burkholderiales bacterium]|nr:RnfH family protein [Burkholderiales bacterium]